MAGFSLVVFDFDGTLADSLQGILSTANFSLQKNGFGKIDLNAIRPFVGLTLEQTLQSVAPQASPLQLASLVSDYRGAYYDIGVPEMKLFPQAKDCLQKLSDEGKTLAIATSKKTDGMNFLLKKFEIGHFFSCVVSEDQVQNKKPFPEMIDRIISKTLAQRAEALMVGDSVYDLRMGKNAKVATCGVSWGATPKSVLKLEAADFLVDSFSQLQVVAEEGTPGFLK